MTGPDQTPHPDDASVGPRDDRRLDDAELRRIAATHPYPLVFATVSGAHLYGFASPDSDVDLRGAHLLPVADLVGLRSGPETVTATWDEAGLEVDLVTHDARKLCRLLLRPDGYVLEQLLSPLVVATTPEHAELVSYAPRLVTRRHAHHYRGFARGQWARYTADARVKPLLYTLRVLLTGIHLMRSGEVVADLVRLADLVDERPPYVAELLAVKAAGEQAAADDVVPAERLAADVAALHATLDAAQQASRLPEQPSCTDDVHALLVRLPRP